MERCANKPTIGPTTVDDIGRGFQGLEDTVGGVGMRPSQRPGGAYLGFDSHPLG